MSDNNLINTTFSGQTGDISFVGSESPVFTTRIDMGGADSLEVPNSAAPSLSVDGNLALDTSIIGLKPSLKYHDGTDEYLSVGMPTSNLNPTNGFVVAYDSASSEFIMREQESVGLINYSIATSSVNSFTINTSFVDTTLTGSITPLYDNTLLYIRAFAYSQVSRVNGTQDNIWASFALRRTTGTPADVSMVDVGRNANEASTDSKDSFSPMFTAAQEISGDTNIHTYVLRHKVPDSEINSSVISSLFQSIMVIYEIRI